MQTRIVPIRSLPLTLCAGVAWRVELKEEQTVT